MAAEFGAAGFHFDEATAGPDEVGEFGAVAGEADAVFEGGALGEGVGVVAEGGEEMKEEGLGFAFFVTAELGGEIGKGLEGFVERGHGMRGGLNTMRGGWQKQGRETRGEGSQAG